MPRCHWNLLMTCTAWSVIVWTKSASGHCGSSGWYQYGDGCYSLQVTSEEGGFATVFHGEAYCAREGATLASLDTLGKHEFVYNLVHSYPQSKRPYRVYIGLHDINVENAFEWVNGEPLNYTMWGPSEPNSNYHGNEDCVAIQSDDNRWQLDGKTTWRDYPCCAASRIKAVICERGFSNSSVDPLVIIGTPFSRTCNIVLSCPPVPVWRDILPDNNARLVGTVVNYTCRENHVLEQRPGATSARATCNTSGVWEPAFDSCVMSASAYAKKMEYVPVEAKGAVAIGTTGLIIMLIEIGIVILVDADHLRAHALMFVRNVSEICGAQSSSATQVQAPSDSIQLQPQATNGGIEMV